MKVIKLITNWHQVGGVEDSHGCGEDYDNYEVGLRYPTDTSGEITKITEDNPGDGVIPISYIIKTSEGKTYRVFNPNHVEYLK